MLKKNIKYALLAGKQSTARPVFFCMLIFFLACLCSACATPSGPNGEHSGRGDTDKGRSTMRRMPSAQQMADDFLQKLSKK